MGLFIVHIGPYRVGPVGSPRAQQHVTPQLQESDYFSNLVKSNFSPFFPSAKTDFTESSHSTCSPSAFIGTT